MHMWGRAELKMESHGQKCPAEVKVQVWKLRDMLREWDVCWLGGLVRLVQLLQHATAKALEGETKDTNPYSRLVSCDCFVLKMVYLKLEGVWNYC